MKEKQQREEMDRMDLALAEKLTGSGKLYRARTLKAIKAAADQMQKLAVDAGILSAKDARAAIVTMMIGCMAVLRWQFEHTVEIDWIGEDGCEIEEDEE